MPYDPDLHHRRSIRRPGYDYTQEGIYFVTICTAGRAVYFDDAEVKASNPAQNYNRAWPAWRARALAALKK